MKLAWTTEIHLHFLDAAKNPETKATGASEKRSIRRS
jgi:hypothetical protein